MSTTVLADVLDGLHDLLDADVTLSADTSLKVFDGPPTITRSWEKEVWVGATGLASADDAATITSAIAAQGDVYDETIEIPCAIWVIGGSTDMRVRRRTATTVYEAVAAAVRAWNPNIAGLSAAADVTSLALRQSQGPDGAAAHATFTVVVAGYWS